MASLPLAIPRLAIYSLTWVLAVIGGSVGLNAIVKRNQQVAAIKHEVAPLGITLHVDTWDLLRPGIVLAVGCAVLAVVLSIWILFIALDLWRSKSVANITKQPISTRSLPLQWMSLAFMSLWLFACNIPVTKAAAEGSAKTTAFLLGNQLPQSMVDRTEQQLGVNPEYWAQGYVRLQIIPPWFTFLFCVISTIVAFIAARKRSASTAGGSSKHSVVGSNEKQELHADKPATTQQETV